MLRSHSIIFSISSVLLLMLCLLSSSSSSDVSHFVSAARHISVWVHNDERTSHAHTVSVHARHHSSRNDELKHPELHQPRHHATAQDAFDADFALVANTKAESVLLHAAATDLRHGMHYDGALGHDGAMEGGHGPVLGVPRDATHHLRAHVPDDTVGVRVLRMGKPHGSELPASAVFFASRHAAQPDARVKSDSRRLRRSAGVLAARNLTAVERRVEQMVSLLTNPTLAILSSGYKEGERFKFFDDVNRVMALLRGGVNAQGVDAGPWKRYISLFNVYSIFEASVDSGATFRVDAQGHQCPAESGGSCAASTADTNLKCAYGSPYPRVLGCEFQEVMELAAMAPKSDVALVIVNSNNYGGSGGAGIAVVSKGIDMELSVVHQLNHAVGGLGDEFDYGVEGTPLATMHNCRPAADAPRVWADWIKSGAIDSAASKGCSYTNLVRPTEDKCLMRKKHTTMCSVCAEGLVQGIYKLMNTTNQVTVAAPNRRNGTSTARIQALTSPTLQGTLDLAAPRCPPFGYKAHVTSLDSVQLTINHQFLAQGHQNVSWTFPTTGVFEGVSQVTVLGSQLFAGTQAVKVDIKDFSPYVSAAEGTADKELGRQMKQTFNFAIQKEDTLTGCKKYTCTTSRGNQIEYCLSCERASTDGTDACVGNTDTRTIAASGVARPDLVIPKATSSQIAGAIATVVVVGCVVLFGGLLTVFCFRRNYVQEILVIKGSDVAAVAIAVFFLVGVFVISILVVVYGVLSLPKVPIFGHEALLGGLILCGALCVMSALMLVATYARSRFGLLLPGIFMTIISIVLIVLAIVALWIASNPLSDYVRTRMKSNWKDIVLSSNPARVCDVQNYLQCSGYEQTCGVTSGASEYCSATCAYSNTYTDPCVTRFYGFFTDDLRPAAIAAFVASFIVLIAGIASIVLAERFHAIITNGRHRRSYRHEPKQPVDWITTDEHQVLRGEFEKIATDPSQAAAGSGGGARRAGMGDTSAVGAEAGALVPMESSPSRRQNINNNSNSNINAASGGGGGGPTSIVPSADAHAAVQFISDAFGESLHPEDHRAIFEAATTENNQPGHITLDRIMHIVFPFMDFGNPFHDPRTLTEEEASTKANAAEVMVAHQRKNEEYVDAAGALPPAKLRDLYMKHCIDEKGQYKAHPNFFEIIKAESRAYGATMDGQMCRGLVPAELDGLRSLWGRLNPLVDGDLNDPALSTLFAVTHQGTKIRTQEHFARWKSTLDVRGRGVGWPEFCLPFAQRAQHEEARRFMVMRTQGDLDVLQQEYGNLDRLMSRREVANEYGEPYVPYVFLPGEDAVPLIRVLAAVVRGDVEVQAPASQLGGPASPARG